MNTRTYERLRAMRAAEQRAAEMAQRVSEQAQTPRTHDEKVRDATAAHIAELQAKLRSGLLLPAERAQLKRRLEILKHGHAQADAAVKEASRIERFRADAAYQNAKEHFAAFSRNPAVAVTEDQIALCGAILNSTAWDSPQAAATAYWAEVARAEEAAYQQANTAALDAEQAALKAEHDAARAKLAALEREQALAQAQQNGGGDAG